MKSSIGGLSKSGGKCTWPWMMFEHTAKCPKSCDCGHDMSEAPKKTEMKMNRIERRKADSHFVNKDTKGPNVDFGGVPLSNQHL